jgi:hypothetical protein
MLLEMALETGILGRKWRGCGDLEMERCSGMVWAWAAASVSPAEVQEAD